MNSIHFCNRCSVYTVCTAATSICASATPTPAATPDTSAPVITVRAPARNSNNATGYVATTVYVGMPNTAISVCWNFSLVLHPLCAVMLLFYAAPPDRCCKISTSMQTLAVCSEQSWHLCPFTADAGHMANSKTMHVLSTVLHLSKHCNAKHKASTSWTALTANSML